MLSPEQLKGRIRNIAKDKDLSSQEILQMFLFERVIDRLAHSSYRNNVVLKGGFLIASMIGIDERTTMDMDTTVQGLPMEEGIIEEIIKEILAIDVEDGITFEFERITPIMEEAEYNNFRVFFKAKFGKINNPMKMDISTGDVITPAAIEYHYQTILGEEQIAVMAYTLPTILAEKYETIIRRNIGNTRARDFYDLYMLYQLHKDNLNYAVLSEAIKRTSKKRGSLDDLADRSEILQDIASEPELKRLWGNYQQEYPYAAHVSFEALMECLEIISNEITL